MSGGILHFVELNTHSEEAVRESLILAHNKPVPTWYYLRQEPIDLAIQLAVCGFAVFPCKNKVPLIKGGHGYKDATTDLGMVENWWEMYPTADIGISVGSSDLFVVDLDRHPGQPDGVAAFRALLDKYDPERKYIGDGPIQRTPSGGFHFFFRAPRTAMRIPPVLVPGVELKVKGQITTGPKYVWQLGHGLHQLLEYPPAFLGEMIAELQKADPRSLPVVRHEPKRPGSLGGNVFDDFNFSKSWDELLRPLGWSSSNGGKYWDRKGRNDVNASITEEGNLYVWTPNAAPLEPGKSYTKVGFYAAMYCSNDFEQARKELLGLGYGRHR